MASGYELRFRDDEWVECVLLKPDEAWHGTGRDRASALESAVRRAFPSRLALELFQRAVERTSAAIEHVEPVHENAKTASEPASAATIAHEPPPPRERSFSDAAIEPPPTNGTTPALPAPQRAPLPRGQSGSR